MLMHRLSPISEFPEPNEPVQDREFRHTPPEERLDKQTKKHMVAALRQTPAAPPPAPPHGCVLLAPSPGPFPVAGAADEDGYQLLPSLTETIEAVYAFTRHYAQLSFIHKQTLRRLRTQPGCVSAFLLLGILGVSARLRPLLFRRYGNGVEASELFMGLAGNLAKKEMYKEPTLERCQAFYLLSVAQQGSGLKHNSSVSDPVWCACRGAMPRFL